MPGFPVLRYLPEFACPLSQEWVMLSNHLFPGALVLKNLPANAGDSGLSPGLGSIPRATKLPGLCAAAIEPVLACAKLLQSCPTLCDPMDGSLPGSSVHGILQARRLEWVAMPGIEPMSLMSPALAGRFFTTSATWEASGGGRR